MINGKIISAFLIGLLYATLLKGQTQIEDSFNTNNPDVLDITTTLDEGNIFLAGVHYEQLNAKRNASFILLSQNLLVQKQSILALQDTSIRRIGGAYQLNKNKDIIIFAIFDVEPAYHEHNRWWGYIILDSNLNRKLVQVYDLGMNPLKHIEGLIVKRNKKQQFYGLLNIWDINKASQYPQLFVMDSALQTTFERNDSVIQIYSRTDHSPYYSTSIQEANYDIIMSNDSTLLVYSTSKIIDQVYMYAIDVKNNKSYEHFAGFYQYNENLEGILFRCLASVNLNYWSDNAVIVSGSGNYTISNNFPIEDSAYINRGPNNIQSSFALISSKPAFIPQNIQPKASKYVFVERTNLSMFPQEAEDFLYPNNYVGAIRKNLDFINPNALFYLRAQGNTIAMPLEDGTRFYITKYDSSFNRIWNRRYIDDTSAFTPTHVVATADGGCLVFLRYRKAFYDDPNISPRGFAPEYDLRVYHISSEGILTGVKNISLSIVKPTLYPNPVQAGGIVHVQGIPTFTQAQLVSTNGQTTLINCKPDQPLQIPQVAPGLYYLRVFSQQWYQFRLLVE